MYLAYFVSFMTIGAVWIEHSALVDALDHIDGVFMRLNLVLLLFCAFLPFPTRMMSEWAGVKDAERIAVVFYGLVLLAMVVLLIVLGQHAEREGLFGETSSTSARRRPGSSTSSRRASSPTSPQPSSGFFLPRLGISIYLLIAIWLAIPIRDVASCSAGAPELDRCSHGRLHDHPSTWLEKAHLDHQLEPELVGSRQGAAVHAAHARPRWPGAR